MLVRVDEYEIIFCILLFFTGGSISLGILTICNEKIRDKYSKLSTLLLCLTLIVWIGLVAGIVFYLMSWYV